MSTSNQTGSRYCHEIYSVAQIGTLEAMPILNQNCYPVAMTPKRLPDPYVGDRSQYPALSISGTSGRRGLASYVAMVAAQYADAAAKLSDHDGSEQSQAEALLSGLQSLGLGRKLADQAHHLATEFTLHNGIYTQREAAAALQVMPGTAYRWKHEPLTFDELVEPSDGALPGV